MFIESKKYSKESKKRKSGRNTIMDQVRRKARMLITGLGIGGSVALGAYKLGNEQPKANKEPTKIVQVVPEEVPLAPETESFRRGTTGKNLTIDIGNKKFEVLGQPQTEKEKEFVKFIFKKINPDDLKKIKEQARKNGSISGEAKIEKTEDLFYLVWNTYREVNNGIRYSPNLLNDFRQARADVKNLVIKEKNAKKDVQQIANQIIEKRGQMNSLLDKKLEEEKAKSKIQKAERLAVMMSVLCRSLDKGFPKEIAANINKEKAYSWTFEGKYPAPPKTEEKNIETIPLNDLLDINDLVDTFLKGKTVEQAVKSIREEIAKNLNITMDKIPEVITIYNSTDIMPKDNKFGKFAQKITSSGTRERLHGTSALMEFGFVNSITIGEHVFYNYN